MVHIFTQNKIYVAFMVDNVILYAGHSTNLSNCWFYHYVAPSNKMVNFNPSMDQ